MLMYGYDNPEVANIVFGDSCIVYNLSSMKMIKNTIQLQLVPPNSLGHLYDKDFDIAYMNWILSNDVNFVNFFQIIYHLYIGKDVMILVSKEDWSENLIESLMKLIQQRYGYNAVQIASDYDYVYAKNNIDNSDFAPGYGLFNLDQDNDRFDMIVSNFVESTKTVDNSYGRTPVYLEGYIYGKR